MSETAEIPLAERLTSAEREISRLSARVKDLTDALRRAERALKPFAARVYNDNHDITVSDTYRLTVDDYSAAYFAHKKICSVIEAEIKGK